ncbi:TatD family hydrolase [soil metagenome]
MTDSHCHLDACADPAAAADPTLRALVSVGTSLESCRTTLGLAEEHDNVWAAVGIHPNDASDATDDAVRAVFDELAHHPKVVAIGETGFDTYWNKETLDTQRAAFEWQAALAAELDKPLILHVRDKQGEASASRAAAEMLRQTGYQKGILHCFNGHEGLLETGLALGWYVSFAGNLTFKNAARLQEVARIIPQDRLLVETDSPYLAPVPRRGRPNTPANVRYTAKFLAELRGEAEAAVEAHTDANAARVYGF